MNSACVSEKRRFMHACSAAIDVAQLVLLSVSAFELKRNPLQASRVALPISALLTGSIRFSIEIVSWIKRFMDAPAGAFVVDKVPSDQHTSRPASSHDNR